MNHATLGTQAAAPTGDLLITGLTLITEPGTVLPDSGILVRGGQIAEIGPSAVVSGRHQNLTAVDARGYIGMPGLINAHTHVAMGFFRGLGHGQDEMIERFFFPAEKSLTPELLAPLSFSYIYAGLVAGVTCFSDHYYFSEGVAQAMERFGVRGVVGETVADLGGAFPGRASWDRWRRLIDAWPYSSRITPSVAPHAADTCSEALLTELATFARDRKLPLHMHLSQTRGEFQRVQQRAGCTPVEFAHRCGALTDLTLAVHLVTSTVNDHKILCGQGVTAGICPASQIIYEQLAPIADLMRAGVPIALATDAAASNDTADLLAEMRLMALLAQDRGVPEEHRSPEAILSMTTENPARAIGLASKIGSLAVGKAADIVFLARDLSTEPSPKLTTNVIYSHTSRNVRHVMVDGRFVLYNGKPTMVDADQLLAEYEAAVAAIHRRVDALATK
ncbi:MAG: amidohydrolase family protein [Deltaproteobacteria bacterium]|nr:amidohydrolase family protein [Deltaproteobacteria bacterium]